MYIYIERMGLMLLGQVLFVAARASLPQAIEDLSALRVPWALGNTNLVLQLLFLRNDWVWLTPERNFDGIAIYINF